jgi:glucosamine-6-phosphate deaminase
MAHAAADHAARLLKEAIALRGKARLIAATGAAQFEFLAALTPRRDIDWSRVELFHLDEYIGLPPGHGASFVKFIRERIIEPAGIKHYTLLDPATRAETLVLGASRLISAEPIDVAFVGIGENAHLAFNDPPADFETLDPYLIVQLDEACRRQQVGEGWFSRLDEVPKQAISMSVRQVLKAREILVIVPDRRKARAVAAALEGPVTPTVPASILQTHPNVTVYLDSESAALLKQPPSPIN